MSIYDVKFYGVYFRYKFDFSGVNIFATREEMHCIPSFENSFFEVVVLREYEGNQDVLKLVFNNGEEAYETLKAPYLYWDMEANMWKESRDKSTPEAFMKTYLENSSRK